MKDYSDLSIVEFSDIILKMITNEYNGLISRYKLEGLLLYSYFCSINRTYRIITQLVIDNKICLITQSDGEYYKVII